MPSLTSEKTLFVNFRSAVGFLFVLIASSSLFLKVSATARTSPPDFLLIDNPISTTTNRDNDVTHAEQEECDDPDQVPFYLSLLTDKYPSETSWKLIDFETNEVIDSEDSYPKKFTLYEKTNCISPDACYQFTIFDTFGDGLSVGDAGNYKMFYDNKLMAENSNFGKKETATLFGNTCPSPSPSISMLPSKSPSPSSLPTVTTEPSSEPSLSLSPSSSPTSAPTLSARPTLSFEPSWSPTSSSMPSSSPIEEYEFVAHDENNRRYFPKRYIPNYPFQTAIVDCKSDIKNVGCVAIPRSTMADPPIWAGTLYKQHPVCNKRQEYCDHRIPIPALKKDRNIDDRSFFSISPFQGEKDAVIIDLPTTFAQNEASTIHFADVNNDGMEDIIFGNSGGGHNQLLISKGNGLFNDSVNLPGDPSMSTTSIAFADVNNDNMIDLIVGNSNNVNTLLLNEGDGNFKDPIVLPGSSSKTRSIVVADMNKDGLIDIIVGNQGQLNELLINEGGSTFKAPIGLPYSELKGTYSISVADFNNDGNMDIIVGNNINQDDELLINEGNGDSFKVVPLPSISWVGGDKNLRVYSISVADVNNDGWVDIILGGEGINPSILQTQLLLNDGTGSFNQIDLLPSDASRVRGVYVVDMNNDGMLDIIVCNLGSNNQLLMNDGRGDFKKQNVIDLPGTLYAESQAMSFADVNGDGMVDFVVCNHAAGEGIKTNQLVMNQSDGRYKESIELVNKSTNLETKAILATDVNGDGIADIIVGNEYENQLLISKGNGSFESIILPDIDDDTDNDIKISSTTAISVADVNGDGIVDIIFSNYASDPNGKVPISNTLLINKGDNEFDADVLPGDKMFTNSLAVADVNDDGLLDIIFGNINATNELLINKGNGKFEEPINLPDDGFSSTKKIIPWSIVAADVDNDDMIDILVGNDEAPNLLLINEGDGTFKDVILLPGGVSKTTSLVVADINNDGMIDIIIGNYEENNILLINKGDGNFGDPINLPGGEDRFTKSISVADLNNDGLVDIIIANDNQDTNQLLINRGELLPEKFFGDQVIELPGGKASTYSVSIADVDNDGILDIVFGNFRKANVYLPYSACPDGGAQFHSRSWCFRCPSFMGRVLSGSDTYYESSICRECIPDYLQQIGAGEQCELESIQDNLSDNDNDDDDDGPSCGTGRQRMLGENMCSKCPGGTFYKDTLSRLSNDTTTWDDHRCQPCSPGQYATEDITAIGECFVCKPGEYQPESGKSSCSNCEAGTFQPEFGSTECKSCDAGGYCDSASKVDGGFTFCPPGSYNDKIGQSNESACELCPSGTYSTSSGGDSINSCRECPPGTYNDESGQTECKFCEEGKYQNMPKQASCLPCRSGTYSDNTGFKNCIDCPYPLSSNSQTSSACTFCREGFYLKDETIDVEELRQNPLKNCQACPDRSSSCTANTNLYDLGVESSYWRLSRKTSRIYKCERSKACVGSMTANKNIDGNIRNDKNQNLDYSTTRIDGSGIYCMEGHKGPLCELCVKDDYYFSKQDKECVACPLLYTLVLRGIGIFLGAAVAILIIAPMIVRRFPSLVGAVSGIGLKTKVKIMVSFYQVISSFEDVYGVKLAITDQLTKLLQFLSLDVFQEVFTTNCIGSTTQQIMISATWPYLLIISIGIGVVVYATYMVLRRDQLSDKDLISNTNDIMFDTQKKMMINLVIVIIYYTLPVVTRGIFSAVKCRAFQNDDEPTPENLAFLLLDMNIGCDIDKDAEYLTILIIFGVLAVIWTVLTPFAFMVILYYIRPSVMSKSITPFADSCRFLWSSYDPQMLFWDVLDTVRKIILIGWILMIDINEGSIKMLRLVIAIIVCVIYHTILLVYRPYKRYDNYILASLSNFLLICCFAVGIILKLCDDQDDSRRNSQCANAVGLSSKLDASIIAVILVMSMLVLTIGLLTLLAFNKTRAPILRMKSTGHAPNLKLSDGMNYHAFISHVWSTGQAQTHAIVRKLQLFAPGLKIWLDVDDLHDISKLEEHIDESAVFILHYTTHYFRSRNCRREIYAAIKFNKPLFLLYEGDDSTITELRKECITSCNEDGEDSPGSAIILKRLLGESPIISHDSIDGPIQWLRDGVFSPVSMNRVYYRILSNLPHHIEQPHKLVKGISVPGELNSVDLKSPVNLLVCESNYGCLDLAEELESISLRIIVSDAAKYLESKSDDSQSYGEQNMGETFEHHQFDLSNTSKVSNRPTFLLLYLNECTFGGDDRDQSELARIILLCSEKPDINIILVHEQDMTKGACKFDLFFQDAPEELHNPPCNLFQNLAVPLHSRVEYRAVSLQQILFKMGASGKR